MRTATQPLHAQERLSYEELHARFEALQLRVTRFSVVEQKLVEAQYQLDEELGRFGRIHAFTTKALNAKDEASFCVCVSESLVDVFEQEFGAVWPLNEEGQLTESPAALVGWKAPQPSFALLRHWLNMRMKQMDSSTSSVPEEVLKFQPPCFEIASLVLGICDCSDRKHAALLVTGINRSRAQFHQALNLGRIQSFQVFAQKVSNLARNRSNLEVIARQMVQIRQSEEQLKLVLSGSNTGFWDCDLTTGTVMYSTGWKAMLGFREDEVGNTPAEWETRLHPEDRRRSHELVDRHLRGETEYFENVARMKHKNGSYVWIMARGRALMDESGKAHRFAGTHLDLSQQKALEQRLREAEDLQRTARKQAEAASRAKSIFVASMSHEIRTPMNGVLGMLQLLQDTTLTEAQTTLVRNAEKSATALLDVIGDILDLSKVEAGKIDLVTRPFEPATLFADIETLMRQRADAKDIMLDVRTPATLPAWVCGDAGRLRQILINVVGNAIKFTDHGSVHVHVYARSARSEIPASDFEIIVRDTGIGFSEDFLKHLFQPFSQDDGSTTRRHDGTGLGLAISRSLIETMGGTISAKSTAGNGSEFRIRLQFPLADAPIKSHATAPVTAVPQRFQGRVLVVDDNETGQTVARLMLQQHGFTVDTAANGAEAASKAADGDYCLVLMDCQMPVMDGFESAREIRRHEQNSSLHQVPIIALTANVQPSDIERCLESGMDDFLPKPLRKQSLISKLALHVRN
jgi:PAS domain S-box-containing protein